MMGNKKLQVWLPLDFLNCDDCRNVLWYTWVNQGGKGKGIFQNRQTRPPYRKLLDLIRRKYVDPVHLDSIQSKGHTGNDERTGSAFSLFSSC